MRESLFLDTADRLAQRLCRDAIWLDNRCNWLGWALEVVGGNWSPVYKAQTPYLYDGSAGIGLFLARLYRFTGDPLVKTTAVGALNRALRALPDTLAEMQASIYSGAAGIAYAAIEIGQALDDDRMIRRGLVELRSACSHPPNAAMLDIISGSAGAIQVLIDVARRFHSPDLIELAIAHGKSLLQTAVQSDAGWSWDTLPGQTVKHLVGYGHGAAGIACALLELWAATGDPLWRQAAHHAFRYERSHFSPENHNWPDLRSMEAYGVPASQPVYAIAWCHGGPGIGLSRLRALELLGNDDAVRNELNEAIQTTAGACSQPSFPPGSSLCLCHGLGGNADLLIAATDLYGLAEPRQIAENAGRQAIEQFQSNELPWPCGVTGAGETPNLMLGLAGIGHFYLRLYDSAQVPSILLLRPAATAAEARTAAALSA